MWQVLRNMIPFWWGLKFKASAPPPPQELEKTCWFHQAGGFPQLTLQPCSRTARPNSTLRLKRWVQRRLRSTQPIPSPGRGVEPYRGEDIHRVYIENSNWEDITFQDFPDWWHQKSHWWIIDASCLAGVILTIYVTVGCTFLLWDAQIVRWVICAAGANPAKSWVSNLSQG